MPSCLRRGIYPVGMMVRASGIHVSDFQSGYAMEVRLGDASAEPSNVSSR